MTREQHKGTSRSEVRTQPNIVRRAARTVERAVRAGAQSYERGRDLPGLIRFDPLSESCETTEAVEAIVARLERALRAERNRARSGHWTYDLNRHIALRQAYLAEAERLRVMKSCGQQAVAKRQPRARF